MSDQLHGAINAAKAIQADIDAAGMGKSEAYTYTIGGVTITTERELPDSVQTYIADWTDDPIWDIWAAGDPVTTEYEPELRAYAAEYETAKKEAWEAKIVRVSDPRAAKVDFLRGDYEAVHARMAIIQAEQLKAIRDLLEAFDSRGNFAESVSVWKGSE